MANAEQTFRSKAPTIMAQLLRDFPITPLDAAAIVGNAGHESAGFTAFQEFKPTVAGSRGGWGWMQWTGPRRKAFEAYCARNKLDPRSDKANYAWLFLELKGIEGTEGAAIKRTVAAKTLDDKVETFEKAFLRAGVKHYDSRKIWANRALDEWRKQGSTVGVPIPNPTPVPLPTPANDTAPVVKPTKIPRLVIILVLAIVAWAIFIFLFNQIKG